MYITRSISFLGVSVSIDSLNLRTESDSVLLPECISTYPRVSFLIIRIYVYIYTQRVYYLIEGRLAKKKQQRVCCKPRALN